MGGLQHCFDSKLSNKKTKMKRLLNTKDESKNLSKNFGKGNKGNIFSWKNNNEKNNNSDDEEAKNNSSIKIKKITKRKNKNLSVENKNLHRKKSMDINNEKKHKIKIWEKLQKLGEGRFGEIYSCVRLSGGENYTVKIYNKINEIQKKRIIKNLNSLYNLNHKNILKAISFNDKDNIDKSGNLIIFYESVNSRNVYDLIKEYGNIDEKLLKIYVKQILEGLEYLHGMKIYHKNIKPTNILVDTETIKLSDCLIDSLILGDDENIYKSIIKSEKINYYIPPFFIKDMNNKKNIINNNISEEDSKNNNSQNINWKAYDLWCLGCCIIEVVTNKLPWSHYNFQNNSEFIKFLGSTNLTPTIPQKLSSQCQELIQVLFNYSLTKEKNIYEKIYQLDFFTKLTTSINSINNINNNLSESQTNEHHSNSDDSNSFSFNNNSQNGTLLGQYLEKKKVINILNNNENASFSVSYITEENNSFSQSFSKLNQSKLSSRKNMNIKIEKDINKYTGMEKVDEALAQNEYSPDYVKVKQENNFHL